MQGQSIASINFFTSLLSNVSVFFKISHFYSDTSYQVQKILEKLQSNTWCFLRFALTGVDFAFLFYRFLLMSSWLCTIKWSISRLQPLNQKQDHAGDAKNTQTLTCFATNLFPFQTNIVILTHHNKFESGLSLLWSLLTCDHNHLYAYLNELFVTSRWTGTTPVRR